ncbi:hypothetical protein [Rubellimicrobium arenae]|uniref:hypothetical protein n=1 Tax=Rubellimicrobium arenae TaxID=2817372 RepID=UPI001B30BC0C|nr:hypothetical protein [Rubellimicrobium arenae]
MLRIAALLLFTLLPIVSGAETLSYTWMPRTEQEARSIRLGLTLLTLRDRLRNEGVIRQRGDANSATLSQSGSGNRGAIYQRGRDHRASLDQTGNRNAHVIIQGGQGTASDVTQQDGDLGVTLQYGW